MNTGGRRGLGHGRPRRRPPGAQDKLPGEDGYSLIQKVRQRESAQGTRAVPAIAITAYARAEDRQTALAAGFDTHVAKPLDPEELLATVTEVAGRGGSPAS